MLLGLGLGPYVLLAVYLGVVAGAFISAWHRPVFGLYVLAPLLPNQTFRDKLHGFPFGDQAIDLLLLGIVVGILLRGDKVLPRSLMRSPIFAVWILTFLTLWTGSLFHDLPLPISFGDPRFSDWKNFCRIPLLMFLVQSAIRERRQMFILIIVMCLGLFWVERGFIESNRGRSFDTFAYEKRDAGTMLAAGENGLAAFLAQSALFLLAFALSQVSIRRWCFTALGLFTTICMMFVFSRGAYLAFLVGFLTLGILKRRGLVFAVLAVIVVSLIVGAELIPGAVVERITMTQSAGGELDASAAGRLVMWDLVMKMFYNSPIIGGGFDTVKYLVNYKGLGNAHNYYVQLLGEMGIAGLLGFLWLLRSAISNAWRLFRTAADPFLSSIGLGGIVCIIAIAIGNCFGDRWSYIEISGYTYIVFGLIARGLEIIQEEDAQDDTADGSVEGTELEIAPISS